MIKRRSAFLLIPFFLSVAVSAQQADKPQVLSHPSSLVADSQDNLFVLMKYGIAKVTPDGKIIDLRRLEGGVKIDKAFGGLVIDSKNNLYASDEAILYKIAVTGNKVDARIYAGERGYGLVDGPLSTAKFRSFANLTIDAKDNIYFTTDYSWIKDEIGSNYVSDNFIAKVPAGQFNKAYSTIRKISSDGTVSTLKTPDGKFILPHGVSGMAIDDKGDIVYSSNVSRAVEKIDHLTGVFIHIAGQAYKRQYCPVYAPGDVSTAELFTPQTIIINKAGEMIYSDERNHRITKIADGKVSTLAGNGIIAPCGQNIGGRAKEGHKDGTALAALFNFPKGLAYDSKGNLYIADESNMCLRRLSPDGIVTSFTTFDRSQAMIDDN